MARFSQEFPVPTPRPHLKDWDIVAPPITSRAGGAGVVGTAFDYLFRFHLKRLNFAALGDGWIAGRSLQHLEGDLAKSAETILDVAAARCQKFLAGEPLSEELLQSAVLLAQLDSVFRSRGMVPASGEFTVEPEDIEDLWRLLSVCPWKQWEQSSRLQLNPDFGEASILVGGADGDFWIDEELYELKTVRDFRALTAHHHQLVGYSALNFLSSGAPITGISIYFARFARTLKYDAPQWEDPRYIPFLCWFCRASTEKFGGSILLEGLIEQMPANLALRGPLTSLAKELCNRDGLEGLCDLDKKRANRK